MMSVEGYSLDKQTHSSNNRTVTCVAALEPAEAWRPTHSARRAGRRQPDARAVWQVGGRQHQNEALDGGDLCAFNRQREAVVKVEVTSFLPFSPPPLSFSQWQRWHGVAWSRQRMPRGCPVFLFEAACYFFASSIPHPKNLHVLSIFQNSHWFLTYF